MAKKPQKIKHIPQRTCVGCREVHSKRTLVRLVRNPDGIFIDPTGKMAGRGAYLHDREECWEKGLKGAIAKALKTDLTEDDKQRLTNFMETLSEEVSAQ
ncbi:MAG: YlxR family protein [Chloroflexota bacterium]|nr:MAG: YlxR family protein [Chloroflexota bacterium]